MTEFPPNRSMPPGVVIPVLSYRDTHEAVAWLCRAFGFTERLRIGDHRSQLVLCGGTVVVTDLGQEPGPTGTAEARTHSVMVRVPDVDAHCAQATAVGARILAAPATHPYGERQYSAEDLAGHHWTFSQTVADVDPASWGGEPRPRS